MHFNKEEKEMWIADWKRSGKSAWAYAKENGLSPQTFLNWTRKSIKNAQSLVEVPAQIMPSVHYVQEILIEKGEVKIHIPLFIGSSELRVILGALGNAVSSTEPAGRRFPT